MDLSCSQHSSSLSQPGIFWELSQAHVVFAVESDPVPLTCLVAFQRVTAHPSDNLHRPKDLCERKAALSLAFFGKGCSLLQNIPSSAGEQNKLSALETKIVCGLIFPCHGLTMQTEKSLRAKRLVWSLASLSDSRKAN